MIVFVDQFDQQSNREQMLKVICSVERASEHSRAEITFRSFAGVSRFDRQLIKMFHFVVEKTLQTEFAGEFVEEKTRVVGEEDGRWAVRWRRSPRHRLERGREANRSARVRWCSTNDRPADGISEANRSHRRRERRRGADPSDYRRRRRECRTDRPASPPDRDFRRRSARDRRASDRNGGRTATDAPRWANTLKKSSGRSLILLLAETTIVTH